MTPSPTPTAASSPSTVVDLNLEIDDDTVWQDVFDTLTAPEQSCISDIEQYELAMNQTVISEDDTEQWEAQIFQCLDPETARDLYMLGIEAGLSSLGAGVDIGDDDRACLREQITDVDVSAVIAATAEGNDTLTEALSLEMLSCFPDLFITEITAALGVEFDQLGDDEQACLQKWVSDNIPAILAGEDDDTFNAAIADMIACAPDLLFITPIVAEFGVELDELGDDERTCLREWVSDNAPTVLAAAENDTLATAIGFEMIACAPDLFIDDHANVFADATPLTVGEAATGTIDYEADVDWFVFQAQEGESYQIDVVPDTMSDPEVSLYDGEENWLDYNDDYNDLAPRIYWQALTSATYYIEVAGYDTGTYKLIAETQ